jgi:hypothetical protein
LGEIVSEFRASKLGYSAFIDNEYQQAIKNASKTGLSQDFPQISHQIPQN